MAWEAVDTWGSGGAEGRKTSLLPVLSGASVGAEDEAGELGWASASASPSRTAWNKEGKLMEAWHAGLAGPPLPLWVPSWSRASQDDHELPLPPSGSAVPGPLPMSAPSAPPSSHGRNEVIVSMLS